MTAALNGPIAYLTGEYPRATDTFIQREVAALRDLGFRIETFSIRRTGAEHIVGPEQRADQDRTFHVLQATLHPLRFLRSQVWAIGRPGRYLSALALAWKTAPKGLRGRIYNMIYLAEAITLAHEMTRRGVVHLHNHIATSSCSVAMLASEMSGIPFSFSLHGPDIFFEPYHWRLDAKIARASFVACISEFCRSQAMLFSDRTHWEKLHIIHCGIDPSRYDGLPGGDGPILFVGRLASVKGIPVLLEAMSGLSKARRDARLLLIGDGPERPEIEAAVRADQDLSSAVTFAGYQSQDAVARHLASSSMLVLPSFAEGVPVVLMEAMAAGKPVIATRVGGVAELVEDNVSGKLVPPGDVRALQAAIAGLLADPAARARMGEAGRRMVRENFDAMDEATRLGILFVSYHSGQPRPAKRPGEPAQ